MPPKNGMRPVHPGEVLREELRTLDLSANALSKALDVPVNRITAILNGQRGVNRRHGPPAGALLRDNTAGLAELAADLRPAPSRDRGWRANRRMRATPEHRSVACAGSWEAIYVPATNSERSFNEALVKNSGRSTCRPTRCRSIRLGESGSRPGGTAPGQRWRTA